MAVPILIVVALAAITVAIALYGRQVARRSGMSDATPVCASCHYSLGGWSTSRCPECGTDVVECGVRIGAQPPIRMLIVTMAIAALLFLGPLLYTPLAWLCRESNCHAHAHWRSAAIHNVHVSMTVHGQWRRFPPMAVYSGSIDVVQLSGQSRGRWMNGQWKGTDPIARAKLTIEPSQPVPDAKAIKAALEKQCPELETAVLTALADDTEWALNEVLGVIRGEGSGASKPGDPPNGALVWHGGGHGGSFKAHWLAVLATALVIVTVVALTIRLIVPMLPSGWRPARLKEWESPRTV